MGETADDLLIVTTGTVQLDAKLQHAVMTWAQELASQGIVITDCDLTVRGWNNWMVINSGLAAAEVLGRPLLEIFPDLKTRRLDRYFRQALAGAVSILSSALHGYLFKLEAPLRDLGFDHMQQSARIAPLVCDGELCGTVTTIDDVTQRDAHALQLLVQHERAHLLSWALGQLLKTDAPEKLLDRLLPQVARHVHAGVCFSCLTSPTGDAMQFHSAGLPAEDREFIRSAAFRELICLPGRGQHGPLVLHADGDTRDARAAILTRLGVRWYICNPLIARGEIIGSLSFASRADESLPAGVIEFISSIADYVSIAFDRARQNAELREAQRALQEHAEELEHKVRERTAALLATVADLESFTYSVAHDLRAPLRHVKGYAKVLLEEHPADISPHSRQYLERIQRATEKMDLLTRDLLHYSTVAQGDLQQELVEVDRVVTNIINAVPELGDTGVLTVHRPLHPVLGNATLVQQCLQNLLENALKFVARDTPPRISISSRLTTPEPLLPAGARGGSRSDPMPAGPRFVRISVTDNGVGVDESAREKIFGVFERACAAGDYEGTGIGLAIVAKAVQRMGGRYGVDSELGNGSTFWLELPRPGESQPSDVSETVRARS